MKTITVPKQIDSGLLLDVMDRLNDCSAYVHALHMAAAGLSVREETNAMQQVLAILDETITAVRCNVATVREQIDE